MGSKVLHEYRDKDDNLVRARQNRTSGVYIDSYTGDERRPEDYARDTVKISSGDGKPSGHGANHSPLKYGR